MTTTGQRPGAATPEVLAEITRRLVARFDPVRIILFGSQARGDTHKHSDVDILLVLESCADKHKASVEALSELRGLGIGTDVVPTTLEDIADHGDLVGFVLRPALREGKVLYERG